MSDFAGARWHQRWYNAYISCIAYIAYTDTYLNIPGPQRTHPTCLHVFPFFHRNTVPRLDGVFWPLGLPQEVPLLNALDCWMSFCIMILVAGSSLYLQPINKSGRDGCYGRMRRVQDGPLLYRYPVNGVIIPLNGYINP